MARQSPLVFTLLRADAYMRADRKEGRTRAERTKPSRPRSPIDPTPAESRPCHANTIGTELGVFASIPSKNAYERSMNPKQRRLSIHLREHKLRCRILSSRCRIRHVQCRFHHVQCRVAHTHPRLMHPQCQTTKTKVRSERVPCRNVKPRVRVERSECRTACTPPRPGKNPCPPTARSPCPAAVFMATARNVPGAVIFSCFPPEQGRLDVWDWGVR